MSAFFALGLRLLMLLFAYITVRITRSKLLSKLNALMMASSKKAGESAPEEVVISRKPPQKSLNIREVNADTELAEAKTVRDAIVARAIKEFNRLYLTDLGVVALYGLLPVLGSIPGQYILTSTMYFFYAVIVFIWITMRFIGHRSQFKSYRSGIFGFLSPLSRRIFFPFQSLWCQSLFVFLMLLGIGRVFWSIVLGEILSTVVFLIPVLVHLYTMRKLRVLGRRKNNIKLLILRVFFLNKSSEFTFSNLAKYWKHFGSYFTVADPSFYRIFWRRQYNNTFPIFIILVFLIFTALTDNQSVGTVLAVFAFFVFLLFIGSILYVGKSINKMTGRFVHSENQLRQRLADLDKWPVKYDNSFKEFPVMCYDNTWKIAVSTLVQEASVIMMDLRGFGEENKGCEYEISYILDHIGLQRILFVCKPEALELVRQTIIEQWARLAETSPNQIDQEPLATVFIAEKEDARELQQIMDLLLKAAHN